MGVRVEQWLVGLWILSAVACSGDPARTAADGGVEAVIDCNTCPEITSMVISPVSLGVGAEAQFSAGVEDADSDPLGYSWFAETGEIVSPQSLSTAYRCVSVGKDRLTFAVADIHGCISQKGSTIQCVE